MQCTHSYKWDQHENFKKDHTTNAREVDKPIAWLLTDLKRKGLVIGIVKGFFRGVGEGRLLE